MWKPHCGRPRLRQRAIGSLDSLHWGRGKVLFAQTHWLCHAFRGEYAGAEMWKPHCGRPRLRQRAIGSLDSLHLGRSRVRFTRHGNNRHLRTAAPTPRSTRVHGKTRPSPIYARAGRAVYRCYLHAPTPRLEPPSSGEESGCTREAERKRHSRRVACAKRSVSRHCRPVCGPSARP